MRIGIDLHAITDFMQGTRTYTINIVKHLLKIDKENKYYLYATENSNHIQQLFSQENVCIKKVFPQQRIIRIPISFPVRLAIDSVDVFHCQYMGPPFGRIPYVVILHDIIHEYMPEFYPKLLCRLMRLFYPLSARKASRVLTISESSKRDIVNYYNIPEKKVIVTRIGVSEIFQPVREKNKIKKVLKKYGVSGPYILFVGRLEPRKNITGLIKAFHDVKRNNMIKHKLVIAGMKYFKYEDFFNLVKDLGLQKDILFIGRVDDEDLPLIYNGASLFTYPAFAEGFGIPPLEAMACGTPVITSKTSSLPEVVGDAGILIDPYNTGDLAKAICEVLSSKNLREKMKLQGLERAKSFSWKDAAKKTLDVYHEVYEESNRKK